MKRRPVQILATGVRVDEYPDPEKALGERAHGFSGQLSPEERAELAAWRAGTLVFFRTTAFVELDAGEGKVRWEGTPQGPFAVDPQQPATSAVLERVKDTEDLLAGFGIHGLRASRIDFYAAPRRIEIDDALSTRLMLD